MAQAAEGANHLVADQQNAVLVDDALNLGPVGAGGNDHAARALHRLADEGGDFLRPELQNALLQPACCADTEIGLALTRQRVLKMVGLLDVADIGDGQIALRVHTAHAAQRGPGHGAAVVGVVAADDDLALRLTQQIPVAAHHAHVGVVALTAAG